MKEFEKLSDTKKPALNVRATTRVGLVTAALQGMFTFVIPQKVSEEKIERAFSVEATDSANLLANILDFALASATKNNEVYDNVRFTLITDKKAEGNFIGKSAESFTTKIKALTRQDLKVEKNLIGEWETTLVFDV